MSAHPSVEQSDDVEVEWSIGRQPKEHDTNENSWLQASPTSKRHIDDHEESGGFSAVRSETTAEEGVRRINL